MLYSKNKEKKLSPELFKTPTAEYRGAPFWAWNSRLDKEELARQIDVFSEMGFGGFHMHVRQGLETEYLGEEFMDAVRFCTDYAKKKGLLAWLYDEDRWPSGVAGGKVTKTLRHRQKFLVMSTHDREGCAATLEEAADTGKPYFVAAFNVDIDSEGMMVGYKKVDRYVHSDRKRYFFVEQRQGGEPRFNYQSYVDALSKDAIDEFISTTYDAFKSAVGDEFGKTVPSIFTDEPQVYGFAHLKSGFDRGDASCSITTDFFETYKKKFRRSLEASLPELFFTTDTESAKSTRYNYYSHLSERFNEAYMDNIGEWCEKAGIYLTGHLLGEDSLWEGALNNADVMRAYRKMQLPGIDILCDDVVYITPIQCRSAVRQYGREGMLTELYGVTGWDFDFRGHKYQGDWQACLGATVRVPHLAWQTMRGEGKRDYPAAISYQSAWYKEYKYLEDHYARVSTALTRGTPDVNIAVVYPIDSYNILSASEAESRAAREALDKKNNETSEWLLSGAYDFDYLSESLLPELCKKGGAPLEVGKMRYDTVIVANCSTLRPHTIKVLREFAERGGKLVIMGEAPTLSLGKRSEAALALSERATLIDHSKDALYRTLRDERKIDIRESSGARTRHLMATMRTDGDSKWVFIANMYKPELPHLINKKDISVSVKGEYTPYIYDTLSGEIREVSFEVRGGVTTLYTTLYDLDTLLLKLEPGLLKRKRLPIDDTPFSEMQQPSAVKYKLSEPNVLLLDMARYSCDGAPLSEREEEIMRIDAKIRQSLGLQERRTKFVQPWAIEGSPEDHRIRLVYKIKSEIDYTGAHLALENLEKTKIIFNNHPVESKPSGYYVDRDIRTTPLPKIYKGENTLEISLPFGLRTDLEACYLVGGFGTAYVGREVRIVPLPDKLHFGSVVNQGLAFYGGNIEYETDITLDGAAELELSVTHYRGALVGVKVDGLDVGRIAFPPFTLRTPTLSRGHHRISYVLYGTRFNTFSALHNLNASKKRIYMGPDFWRSEGEAWAYEYETRPMGILKTPIIRIRKK